MASCAGTKRTETKILELFCLFIYVIIKGGVVVYAQNSLFIHFNDYDFKL